MAEENAEAAQDQQTEGEGGSKGKMKLMIMVAAAVLVLGGGFFAFTMMKGGSESEEPVDENFVLHTFEPLTVNIHKSLGTRHLVATICLKVSNQEALDELLAIDESARSRIREVHPEICFWALADGRPMAYSKKKPEGEAERQLLLEYVYSNTGDIVDYASCVYKQNRVAKDDVLDALAAAVTASAGQKALRTIPEEPEIDARGLPMEMVYRHFLEL